MNSTQVLSEPSVPELTACRHSMHRLLFSHRVRSGAVTDTQMWCALRELRAVDELGAFQLWLVGSRIEPGKHTSDIDLVLSPKAGCSIDDALIERALWHCRHYGFYGADPTCVIDACFRANGPTLTVTPLRPQTAVRTVKLLSPKLLRLLLAGHVPERRSVGRFSIEFVRRAGDTSYYRKLPCLPFGPTLVPYLRPAIEIRS
jgi:hypothetical protein